MNVVQRQIVISTEGTSKTVQNMKMFSQKCISPLLIVKCCVTPIRYSQQYADLAVNLTAWINQWGHKPYHDN